MSKFHQQGSGRLSSTELSKSCKTTVRLGGHGGSDVSRAWRWRLSPGTAEGSRKWSAIDGRERFGLHVIISGCAKESLGADWRVSGAEATTTTDMVGVNIWNRNHITCRVL
jgi:hypothetical protein